MYNVAIFMSMYIVTSRFVLSVDKSYVVKRTPSPISKPVDGLTLYVADRAVSTGS